MYTQQDQQYLFFRGDSTKYTQKDKITKQNYLQFHNVYPNFIQCDTYCKYCTRTSKTNCLKCVECLRSEQHRPKLLSKIYKYPSLPKEKPLIPFPFFETLPQSAHSITEPQHQTPAWSTANVSCKDFCSPELCQAWEKQKKLYEECKRMHTNEDCRIKFGCKQWEGWRFRHTAPLAPYLTDCELCWKNNYTNISS